MRVHDQIQRQVFCSAPALLVSFPTGLAEHDLDDWQRALETRIFLHPHSLEFPRSSSNRLAILKKLIRFLEDRHADVRSEIYELYVSALASPPSVSEYCFKTYCFASDCWLTLKEKTQIISNGTTGLSTWTAAFVLVDWISSHRDLFAGKSVLELGSGTGFVGLSAALLTEAAHVELTDCHPDVLRLLGENVEVNRAQDRVTVSELDWCSFTSPSRPVPAFVVASDVVFDPSICEPLSCVVASFASEGSTVLIALTLRNEETHQLFLDAMAKVPRIRCRLIFETASPVGALHDCYAMIAPVRVFEIAKEC
jgi:predicted nicotinamide N-methyase